MKTSLALRCTLVGRIALAVFILSMAGLASGHAAPPPNDNLANAQLIPTGSSFTVDGTEINASQEAFEKAADYPYNDLKATVWYSWTPSVSGVLNLKATGGSDSTGTLLYKGPDTPSLSTLITGNGPGIYTPPAAAVTAGQQYFICIGNPAAFHDFTLTGQVTESPTPPPTDTPVVTVKVKTPTVSRSAGTADKVSIELSSAPAASLTVAYKMLGTAVNGTDYKMLSGSVTVPAGATKAAIKLKPLPGGSGTVKAKLKLVSGDGYKVGSPATGKVKIVD